MKFLETISLIQSKGFFNVSTIKKTKHKTGFVQYLQHKHKA